NDVYLSLTIGGLRTTCALSNGFITGKRDRGDRPSLSIPIRHAVGMDSELVKLLGNPGELPADH
ncbi:MAG: hypothetical protein HC780_18025, partial [Leptolyngbyaceae cyanobacterium CSU_1_3]|nr:hypothetical protein [Leptolyngbyaceae cyanobacterium CSU_1_3]